ncbi:Ribonuclease h domain [Thalictrum thalictroides]|uniref:Ribonuclease h domain n=1 Tax=Thalictrum thalictroides TaxID=46969 RepID=A0A7J6UYH4_THATH|nr:Ribonuclease h domain [Thalictrum thalictroides]
MIKGKSLKKLMAQAALAATVYWIWAERNRLMYDEGNGTPQQLFRIITRDVSIRITSMKKRFRDTTDNRLAAAKIGRIDLIINTIVKPVRWEKPREGWYKLNADGSFSENKAGYGEILRNNKGMVSFACTVSSSTRSILFLELMGLAAGLEIALKMGEKKININSESLLATRILRGQDHPT